LAVRVLTEYIPTPEQTAQWPRHIVAAAAAVFDDGGRVLLVRSGWRGWEFPGGQVELGEDLLTGLAREVAEESGCQVTVGRLLGVYSTLSPPYIVQFLFRCAYTGGDPTPSAETPEVGWFTPAEARQLVIRPSSAGRLRDALADAPGVVYRAYRLRPYELVDERRLGG
jgi:ADP-ribose pyrophosphatase YjhB (NUDIX family)